MKEYDFLDLKAFVTVVEAGSFAKAAEQMDVSTAAISRRIAALETRFSSQLLARTTRRIDLTDAGRMLYGDAINIFQLLDEADERVREGRETVKGNLKIAAPVSFGFEKIAPLLPLFMQQYPQLKVSLILEDRLTDLQAEGIDIAVRIGMMADSSLVATPIASISRICCASPLYLKSRGTPSRPAQLGEHQLLHYSNITMTDEWAWLYSEQEAMPELGVVFSSNNAEALREMAVKGMGVTVLPEFIVEDAIDRGELIQIFKKYTPPPLPLHAVRPSRQFTPARVRAFIEFLQASFAR